MRALAPSQLLLVIVLGLTSSTMAQMQVLRCDEELINCGPDDPPVCILHPKLWCFIKFEHTCIWKQMQCMFHLNYKIYDLEYCELENFACRLGDKDGELSFDRLNNVKSQEILD